MPDPLPPDPLPDDSPDPDADLIAYLDGELEGEAAREVEARLALDPETRAKAEAYKKTFHLLDHLPRKEPSPDFATRTLTRLQPVLEASGSGPVPTPASPSAPTLATTGPMAPRRLGWLRGVGWLAAGLMALVGGYAAHAALKPYLEPPPRLDLDDWRVVENLPLYLGVDDLEFVRKLDEPDLFAPDHWPTAGSGEGGRPELSPTRREKLIALFKSFTLTRQQQLRELDQQLHTLPTDERDRLFRVLEGYAVWLDRLPEADRRDVLTVAPADRLEKVRQVKEKHWRESLSARQRERLKQVAADEERLRLIEEWKAAERARRDEWQLARRQWDDLRPDRKPWPFSDPALAEQIDAYLKKVLKVDLTVKLEPKGELPASWRVTREEYADLKARYEAAHKEGGWSWFLYGRRLYQLAERHPYLPEPGFASPLIEPTQLESWPAATQKALKQKGGLQTAEKRFARGKWPEFALEVDAAARKAGITLPEPLGPAAPGEFTEPVNQFLVGGLLPRLTPTEKATLKKLEGKWPEYPKTMLDLARRHDLPVPGVTLPGRPSQWARFYALTPPGRE